MEPVPSTLEAPATPPYAGPSRPWGLPPRRVVAPHSNTPPHPPFSPEPPEAPLRPAHSNSHSNDATTTIVLATSITGGILLIVLALAAFAYFRYSKMKKFVSTKKATSVSDSGHGVNGNSGYPHDLELGGTDKTSALPLSLQRSSSIEGDVRRTDSLDSFMVYMDNLGANHGAIGDVASAAAGATTASSQMYITCDAGSPSTFGTAVSSHPWARPTGGADGPYGAAVAATAPAAVAAAAAAATAAVPDTSGPGASCSAGSSRVADGVQYGPPFGASSSGADPSSPTACTRTGSGVGTGVTGRTPSTGAADGCHHGSGVQPGSGPHHHHHADALMSVITERTPRTPGCRLDVDFNTEIVLEQGPEGVLGKGCFGTVCRGTYLDMPVAVKIINSVWTGSHKPSELESFRQEVAVLSRCNHRNIVRLHGACLSPPHVCLVEELMAGSLDDVIHDTSEPLSLTRILMLARDIACGLSYLHPTVLHRDLKPANVLLDDTGTAKLVDFGLARLRTSTLVTNHPEAGTCAYMAPECFDDRYKGNLKKCDIFSLGVLLWEMLTRRRPWEGLRHVVIAYTVVQGNRLPIPKDSALCPPKLRKVIERCWHADPEKRPEAAALVKLFTILMEEAREQPVEAGENPA